MKQIIVIGGGFFGMYIAEYCALQGHQVTIIEQSHDYMQRASYVNQARVHNGYHYPRSVLTALRSRVSFPRFNAEFQDCIKSDFKKYYMVGKVLTKVTALQFEKFCHRIGAPCEPAPANIAKLTNPKLVEATFATVEYAFDATKIKTAMHARIASANVISRLGWKTVKIDPAAGAINSQLGVTIENIEGDRETLSGDHVFNCTYSNLNQIIAQAQQQLTPLKHELAEMCIVEMPPVLRDIGITLMCGPFFSTMPFPTQGLHSFSHVRYTPHYEWLENSSQSWQTNKHQTPQSRKSAWSHMQHDAQRYIPILADCTYKQSLWEVKTTLPSSEADDSRPILFKTHYGLRGFHCVMGGKIDNVYDVINVIESQRLLV